MSTSKAQFTYAILSHFSDATYVALGSLTLTAISVQNCRISQKMYRHIAMKTLIVYTYDLKAQYHKSKAFLSGKSFSMLVVVRVSFAAFYLREIPQTLVNDYVHAKRLARKKPLLAE